MTASHIAIILHDFSTGGSERIAIRLANAWAASGRRVTLMCGTEQGAARHLVAPGVAVEACTPETVRSPWSRVQVGWRLARLVRTHRPDVIFSPGNFHLIVLAVLGRMSFSKRPVFLSKLSNPLRRAGLRSRLVTLADAVIRRAATPVDALIAMSPTLGQEAREVFGSIPVVEINEPILERQAAMPAAQPLQRDHRLILCIGRLCPQKDFSTALRAFALVRHDTDARLLILGEGPLRGQLRYQAARLGIDDRVDMPGYVTDVARYLPQADLLLMTSRYEGYPAVLIEAIAAGLPVVTTDCSLAIREIVSSDALGSVTGSRDPADIARAIIARLQLPRAAAETIARQTECHRIDKASRAYLDLFDRLVA